MVACPFVVGAQSFQVQVRLLIQQVVNFVTLFVLNRERESRAVLDRPLLLLGKFDVHVEIIASLLGQIQSAGDFERQHRVADTSNVVQPQHLHALPCEAQRGTHRRLRPVRPFVADEFPEEALARVSH